MATLSAADIYRVCRQVGFSPNQSATMTAIALAESGGNTDAHNPNGEDSWGLFQINKDAHDEYAGLDLTDPVSNAKAAFEVSGGGENITPWTVTHARWGAVYTEHQQEALAAAAAYGDVGAVGNFTNPPYDYGEPVPAALDGSVGALNQSLMFRSQSSSGDTLPAGLQTFLNAALAQSGDQYVWGGKASPDNPDPTQFDCSGLLAWAAGRAGVSLEGGVTDQWLALIGEGGEISIEDALRTPGAVLFRGDEEHVAISLGNGKTIEARGKDYGVGEFEANTERFQKAAIIPELYGPGGANAAKQMIAAGIGAGGVGLLGAGAMGAGGSGIGSAASMGMFANQPDSDGDGLPDALELLLGLDPSLGDTDGDGLSDRVELLESHTNPLAALDSDLDLTPDNVEVLTGGDPTTPDGAYGVGQEYQGFGGAGPDTDGDRLSDALELALRLNPNSADTDGDGLSDGDELFKGLDPHKADSNDNGMMDIFDQMFPSAQESDLPGAPGGL